ncbi:cysteine synthase A [Numidum massiliense]|uniref:cysteine synthase A n=1 Tax=Numidum massiliense TaxID=1522315 RepID=UPI0006D57677|nr:cysteine synthase A [Numidum massiliense]
MQVFRNVTELIGNTPLVKLTRLRPADGADVYVKLESFNPGRSVKDRAAYHMIIRAEREGLLQKGATIIEPTSGNTGIGLAMVAAARGYRSIFVMPDTMSEERIRLLKAYGARVVLTPGEQKMPGAIEKAQRLLKEIPGSFMPMQFENSANPDSHRETTAVEIIAAMDEIGTELAALIATAGTGGTVTGTGETLKKRYPHVTVHVVEPAGSPVLSGGAPGSHKLVGTSPGFIPPVLNRSVYDEIIQIDDEQAYDTVRRLAKEEGILVGPSSGASVYAAMQVAKRLPPTQVVVCIAPDSGERYLSTDLFVD